MLNNTFTHTHTHTLDLHAKFQPPRAKTVAVKEWGNFVDRPTNHPTNIVIYGALVAAKNRKDKSLLIL